MAHGKPKVSRKAKGITPVPKPKKRKGSKQQGEMVFDEGKGISPKEQQYDPNPIINEIRGHVNDWRNLAPNQWQVTAETQRLLQHWRHHKFSGQRPFFCQIEAAETAIWLANRTLVWSFCSPAFTSCTTPSHRR